jgi:hypothetical protein
MKTAVVAPFAALIVGVAAHAQAPTVDAPVATPVAVIVKVPKPWYAPRAVIVSKMRDTIPQYESLPGLSYKMYSFAQSDGQFGGIYLWKDAASAQAWFNPAWFDRVKTERGVDADVRYFEVPVALDNVSPSSTPDALGEAVATLVTVPVPPGADRAQLIAEFRKSIPIYQQVPGLRRKYFVITDDARFGGIYLWENQASAERWFDDAWHQRVRKTYGADAVMEWFDIPILLPSKVQDNRIDLARP